MRLTILLLPLLSSFFSGFFGRFVGRTGARTLTVFGMIINLFFVVTLIVHYLNNPETGHLKTGN